VLKGRQVLGWRRSGATGQHASRRAQRCHATSFMPSPRGPPVYHGVLQAASCRCAAGEGSRCPPQVGGRIMLARVRPSPVGCGDGGRSGGAALRHPLATSASDVQGEGEPRLPPAAPCNVMGMSLLNKTHHTSLPSNNARTRRTTASPALTCEIGRAHV